MIILSLSGCSFAHHLMYEYLSATFVQSCQILEGYLKLITNDFTHRGKASILQSKLARSRHVSIGCHRRMGHSFSKSCTLQISFVPQLHQYFQLKIVRFITYWMVYFCYLDLRMRSFCNFKSIN